MASKSNEVLQNTTNNHLPETFLGLIQKYLDTRATSLKSNPLAAYPIHGVWLSFASERRRYLVDRGYTLSGCFRVEERRWKRYTEKRQQT